MTDAEMCSVFANNLNNLMNKNDISQTELANRCNAGISTIHNWCTGINIPRTPMLNKLTVIFGCSVSDLIGENMKKPTSIDGLSKEDIDFAMLWHTLPDELKTSIRNLVEFRLTDKDDSRP